MNDKKMTVNAKIKTVGSGVVAKIVKKELTFNERGYRRL